MAKHFHCPVNGWDCPYYKDEPHHPCVCTMENPYEECDDFIGMYDALAEGIGEINPDDYTDDHGLICTECGGAIDESDAHTMNGQDKIIRYCYGHCMNCDAPFGWTEEYILKSVSDFKKMEP